MVYRGEISQREGDLQQGRCFTQWWWFTERRFQKKKVIQRQKVVSRSDGGLQRGDFTKI